MLKHLPLAHRLLLLACTAIAGLLILSGVSLVFLRAQLIDAEIRRVNDVVDSAYAVFDHFHAQEVAGKMSLADAQHAALELIRRIRYENGKNYIFVSDDRGTVLLSPLRPETEGQNMLGQLAPDGAPLWDRITEVARTGQAQIITYGWPRTPGARPEQKHSHVKPYQPWHWAYGAGVYLTAVDEAFTGQLEQTLLIGGVVLLIFSWVSWRIMRSVTRQLGGDPREAARAMHSIAAGDFDITVHNRGTEDSLLGTLGKTVTQLQSMRDKVRKRTQELEEANEKQARLLDQLRATQQQLVQSEKLAALGSLVAGMAHELGTPIGNSLVVASTIEEHRAKLAAEMESGLRKSTLQAFLDALAIGDEALLRNLHRAADLVTRFKEVSLTPGEKRRKLFKLRDVAREVEHAFEPVFHDANCIFVNAIPPGLVLEGYPEQLGEALAALATNAIHHGLDGRADGSITISASEGEKDTIVLSFSDNGNGIPAEHLPKIFDPFFTTKLGKGGSGLGLNIVYNIVTGVLGGTITVESTQNEGTHFHIILPKTAPGTGGSAEC